MSQSSTGAKKSMINDLTEGSVPKLLFKFAFPLFVSNALQSIYNVVDMMVVGQVLGGVGMSAVSNGGNVLNILTFVVMGFSSAGQVLIARDVGGKKLDSVKKTIGTMFSVLLSIAILISIFCFAFRNLILRLINTPEEAYAYTSDYLLICSLGLLFIYGYNIVGAIMRGMGDSKRPFIFVAIASVINIVLDILFVAVLHFEVKGAALATVIGQGFSFIYALWYLYRNRENFAFDFAKESFIPDPTALKRLTALGIPMAMQSAAITISMTVVAAWVNSFGVVASACAGLLSKLNAMVGTLSHSLTAASSSMVGQNLGAKKYKRVPKILLWATCGACLICSFYVVILVVSPNVLFGLFTKDAEILSAASVLVVPAILGAYGSATRCFAFGIINGSGNSKLNLLVAILDGVIGRIGLAYLFGWAAGMGPLGFWMGDAIAGYVPLCIGLVFYMTGKWREKEPAV